MPDVSHIESHITGVNQAGTARIVVKNNAPINVELESSVPFNIPTTP